MTSSLLYVWHLLNAFALTLILHFGKLKFETFVFRERFMLGDCP